MKAPMDTSSGQDEIPSHQRPSIEIPGETDSVERRTRARQQRTVSNCTATKMEEQQVVSQTLPEDLVEKIIARMPFPYIFKARGLSKSWLARFSSPSSQDDESKKCLATIFQKEVSLQSRAWESFSLVFIGKEDLIAYNQASKKWRGLPSLSFLPQNIFRGNLDRFLARSYVQMEGPLLYCINHMKNEIHVANLLTRSWRPLPIYSQVRLNFTLCDDLVVDPSSDTYKLILLCQGGRTERSHLDYDNPGPCLRIYDSKSNSWTSKYLVISADFTSGPSTSVYLNGIVYMVAANNPQNLLAINVEDGTSEELRLSCEDVIEMVSINLVVCKGDWLMIVTKGLYPETLQVLKVDLGLLRLVQLAKGPPDSLNVGQILAPPVGDGNCIFFRVEEGVSRVLKYDVDEDDWICFPVPTATTAETRYKWIGYSFQPGLSPFVAV